MSTFVKGETYSRAQVAELIDLPPQRRHGGNWSPGYDIHDGEAFIFCNVGEPGRTGHDYANAWKGDELVWHGKSGTRREQPQIQKLIGGKMPVHVFWRRRNRDSFTYAGSAVAAEVDNSVPVRVRWRFK